MLRVILVFFATVHLAPFLFARDVFSEGGVAWVFGIGASFFIGIAVGLPKEAEREAPSSSWSVLSPSRWALPLVGVCYFALRTPQIGPLVAAIIRGEFAAYALETAVNRYVGGEAVSPLFNVGTTTFFVLLGLIGARSGIADGSSRSERGVLMALVALAVAIESASLARAGVLMGLTLLAALFLFNRRFTLSTSGWRPVLIGYGAVALGITGIFLFSALFRLSRFDGATEILLDNTRLYWLGGHEAFLRWAARPSLNAEAVGYYSFASLYKLLGVPVPSGLYDPVWTSHGDTNIFLVYRGLFADFGLLGGVASIAMIGWAVAQLDRSLPNRASVVLGVSALCMVLYPIVSPFIFSTFSLAVMGLVAGLPLVRVGELNSMALK